MSEPLVGSLLELQWREMREEDRNYVLSSWLRSYADGSEFRHLARGVYFALYKPVVMRLLDCSTVAIAWTPELPDSVLGWLAIEGTDVVHYLLVKPRWRRLGIAKWMTKDLRQQAVTYTHFPPIAGMNLVGPTWQFDPMRRFEKRAA